MTPITTRSKSNIQADDDFNFASAAEAVFGSHEPIEETPCFPVKKQPTLRASSNSMITPKSMKNANIFVGRLFDNPIADKKS